MSLALVREEALPASSSAFQAVAALRDDIASSASASKGLGQVGFSPALAYGPNTAGLAIQREGVTPRMFGAAGDGVTDDTTAMQAWAASVFPHALDEGVTYYVTGAISLPAVIDGRGATIKCSSAARLTCAGAITAISALSVSPAAGDQALTFSSAHGLSDSDVIVIYNPTANSFSSVRPEYKAGEFCRVGLVTASTTVDLAAPLYAGYTAANVNVYKLTRMDVAWRNLTVIGPDAVAPALKISLATSVALHNVRVAWANYMAIYLDRCKDVTVVGGGCNVPKSGTSDCFGFFVGNSQDVTVHGGNWYALRNAADCGGDNVTACVPNRNIRWIGAHVANKTGSTGPAFNLHANAEYITFEAGKIVGGASFEGRDVSYLGSHISGAALGVGYLIGGGSECLGGTYAVRGCTLVGGPAYSTALVRVSNAAAGLRDCTLIVEDCTVTMGSCQVLARNDMGSATYKANAIVDGVTFTDGAPSMTTILRMVGTGAAGAGDQLVVDRISNAPSGTFLFIAASGYDANTPARLMEQRGTASVALTSASPVSSVTATYRYSYGSKIPKVAAMLDARIVGTHPLAVAHRLKSAASCTFDIFTTDNANAGAAPTVAVDYTVSVSEI